MRPQLRRDMPALGEEFRSAREARGLSLSDVAERLHIRSVYLGAIEDEDWNTIGAPVYVRGFMRTYARFLGLDAEAAVARFATFVPAAAPPPTSRSATSAPASEDRPASARSGPSVGAMVAIAVAVVLIAFVGYEYYQYRTDQPGGIPVAAASASPSSAAATAAPDATTTALESPAPSAAPVFAPSPRAVPSHGLSVRVTQTSWLRVAVDGTVRVEGIFPAGTAKSFTGKSADVRVGNAGGVRIALNGRDLGPLGASGDVVERQFVLGGE